MMGGHTASRREGRPTVDEREREREREEEREEEKDLRKRGWNQDV